MSGGNNAHIHLDGFVVAHALQLAALDKAQQLGLQPERHFADLVKKQRASVGRLNPANPSLHRSCEGPAGVAEELGLKQSLRNCRAVDGDKRLAASHRKPVHSLGYQFFARAGWPFNQHRSGARSHQADAAADIEHAGSVADQIRQPLARLGFYTRDGQTHGDRRGFWRGRFRMCLGR